MPTLSTTTVKTAPAFPADAVTQALRDELVTTVRAEAKRKARPIPTKPDELVSAAIEIDSRPSSKFSAHLMKSCPFRRTNELYELADMAPSRWPSTTSLVASNKSG